MNRDAIRAKAIERGLLRADTKLPDDQLFALTQTPGFSTASKITQVAGRGVGMDVVANEIKQLGGTLTIDSQQGKGTTFTLRLPFTLAVTQAILVKHRRGGLRHPDDLGAGRGAPRRRTSSIARLASDDPTFEYGGESYAIHDLAKLLNVTAIHATDEAQLPLAADPRRRPCALRSASTR